METTFKPKRCPFCRSTDLKIIKASAVCDTVECQNCNATGPWAENSKGNKNAILMWNAAPRLIRRKK